jgi:hypothetical protein
MANSLYTKGLERLIPAADAHFVWKDPLYAIGVMLVKSTYTFSVAHAIVSDVTTWESSGTGYIRKPILIGARTTVTAGTTRTLRVTAGTVKWTSLTTSPTSTNRAVLFVYTADGLEPNGNILLNTWDLLCYIDTGTNVPIDTNGGDVTLDFHATDGVIKYSIV